MFFLIGTSKPQEASNAKENQFLQFYELFKLSNTSFAMDLAELAMPFSNKSVNQPDSKFELYKIFKPDSFSLAIDLLKLALPFSGKPGKLKFLQALLWMQRHRCKKDGHLYVDGCVYKGPFTIFAAAATKHPILFEYADDYASLYQKNLRLNPDRFRPFIDAKDERYKNHTYWSKKDSSAMINSTPLHYGNNIETVELLVQRLKEAGIDTSLLDTIDFNIKNGPNEREKLERYYTQNHDALSPSNQTRLEKILYPERFLPSDKKWSLRYDKDNIK